MASKAKARTADPVLEAAVDYFASRSHDAWRREFLKNNPDQKGKQRMRMRGGVMVDINQPWAKLHPAAKAENKIAARDAYDAVKKFPNDREAAADDVHKTWIKRNKKDPNQPKELFKPYSALPEIEKDKDRAHVDIMKEAIAAVRKKAVKKPIKKAAPKAKAKAKSKPAPVTLKLDARASRRVEAAAKQLSKAVGREVPPEALLAAASEAVVALAKAMASQSRGKRA